MHNDFSTSNFWKHTDNEIPPMYVECITIQNDLEKDVPLCGYRCNIKEGDVHFISESSPSSWIAKYWKFKNDYDARIYKTFKVKD